MIGFYDYTVILTYLSVVFGVSGIMVCLNGVGHPFYGAFFLMLSGLCDTFDGRVARSKKNRTEMQKSFGVQIDSLADMIAFGILPPCIGLGMVKANEKLTAVPNLKVAPGERRVIYPVFLILIILIYVLCALIRLAYFNVLEEEKKKAGSSVKSGYIGLPVTSASLIFPAVLLIQYQTNLDMTFLYFGVLLVTAALFVSKIHVPKPGLKAILILVAIGVAEFIALLVMKGQMHIAQMSFRF